MEHYFKSLPLVPTVSIIQEQWNPYSHYLFNPDRSPIIDSKQHVFTQLPDVLRTNCELSKLERNSRTHVSVSKTADVNATIKDFQKVHNKRYEIMLLSQILYHLELTNTMFLVPLVKHSCHLSERDFWTKFRT